MKDETDNPLYMKYRVLDVEREMLKSGLGKLKVFVDF
jgi:hypothetical protein